MQGEPYQRKAQYHETDKMGIIHHSNFIRWFEEARVDFMEKVGFRLELIEERGVFLPLTHLTCEYKAMVRFGEIVNICCAITFLTNTRFNVEYRIAGADGEIKATGETRHCFLNRNGRPVSLKKSDPELFGLFSSLVRQDF